MRRQRRALEDDLGVALFRRSHRALALTEAGARLFAACTTVLAQLRAGGALADLPPARWAAALRDLRGEPPPTGWRKLRERIAGGSAADRDEA